MKKELGLSDVKSDYVSYGLSVFINGVIGYASIMIVAWLFGVLELALVSALTASGLRVLSGGAHSDNLRNCSLLGAVISPGCALIAKYSAPYLSAFILILLVAFIWLFSLLSVIRYAPADTPNKPITNEQERKRLRRLSLVFLLCWFIILGIVGLMARLISAEMILTSTLGLFWQAFSLTPLGYRLVKKLDEALP